MLRALSTAATGMDAEQTRLDVTSNNIANVATPGFKKARAEFEDVLYQVTKAPGSATSQQTMTPTGLEVGMGVRTAGTSRLHSQGAPQQTGNPLDVCIEGDGFFGVHLPNGEVGYTRDGSFKTDAEGRLVNREGFPVVGDVTLPPDTTQVTISPDGTVNATVPGQTEPVEAGHIQITTFVNASGLVSAGHNLYRETPASGTAQTGRAGENGTGRLSQYALEGSNVKIVEEMIELISGQRAYEVNSRVIKAADEMLQTTAQLR